MDAVVCRFCGHYCLVHPTDRAHCICTIVCGSVAVVSLPWYAFQLGNDAECARAAMACVVMHVPPLVAPGHGVLDGRDPNRYATAHVYHIVCVLSAVLST